MRERVPIEERLDYMPGRKRSIFQRKDVFSFSMDAVLLAQFASIPGLNGKGIDLCAGNAAIPLMMTLRTKAIIDAVEIQTLLCELARKSVSYNGLDGQVNIIEADICDLEKHVSWESYECVTCNPPYFPVTSKKGTNDNQHISMARHEITCTLEDVVQTAAKLVKPKGRVALVHRPERVVEIFAALKRHRLEPKRLQYVHPHAKKQANMVLIEAVQGGNTGIKTLAPLIVYDDKQQYTKEFKQHYEQS